MSLSKICSLLLSCTWLYAIVSSSQTSSAPKTGISGKPAENNTYFVSCGQQSPFKVRVEVSRILTSSNGENAAYTRVRVSQKCVNQSELLIKGRDSKRFRLRWLKAPTEYLLGNGIQAVDWSPDNRYLLFETIDWQYGSDADADREIAVYDADGEYFIYPDQQQFFANEPKECLTYVRGLGFVDSTHVAVLAHSSPYFDPAEDKPRDPRCPTYDRVWSLGIGDRPSLERLPETFVPKKYGRVSAH
jgi:hypothetical protein